MKVVIFIFVFSLSHLMFAENANPVELRRRFYASLDDAKSAKLFLSEFENSKNSLKPIEQGYRAAISMVMAKHVFNPYSKLKYFIDGKNELETAIASNPKNVELILIRFAIQSNVPSFLGYNSNINTDKKFLLEHLIHQKKENVSDADLTKIIKQYLTESKYCSATEKETIVHM